MSVPANVIIDEGIRNQALEESLRLTPEERNKAMVQSWDAFVAAGEAFASGNPDHTGDTRAKMIQQHSVWFGHREAKAYHERIADEAREAKELADSTKARIINGNAAPQANPALARRPRDPAVLGLYRNMLEDEALDMQGLVNYYRNPNMIGIDGTNGRTMPEGIENARRLAEFFSPSNIYDPLAAGAQMAVTEATVADGTIPAGPYAPDPNVPSASALGAIPVTPTANTTIKYRRKGTFPLAIVANVLETQDSPEWTPTTTSAEEKVQRISLRYAITRPAEMDDQGLAQEFDQDLVDAVRGKLTQQVLYGSGTVPQFKSLSGLGATAVEHRPYTTDSNTKLDYEHFAEALDEAMGLYGGGTGGLVMIEANPNTLVLNRLDWYNFTSALMTKDGALSVPISSLTSMVSPAWRTARVILDEQVNQFASVAPSAKNYFGFLFNNNPRFLQLYVAGNYGIQVTQLDQDKLRDSMSHIIHFYGALVIRAPKSVVLLYQATGSADKTP